jgi:hypothetical protein
MRVRTTRRKKKKERREKKKNNPSFHSCSSEYETSKANVVQGQQTLFVTSH